MACAQQTLTTDASASYCRDLTTIVDGLQAAHGYSVGHIEEILSKNPYVVEPTPA